MATFDGDTLTITMDSGVTEADVFDHIYEPWKDWMLASPLNRKYPQAFRSDGGNPLSSIINQGAYIFLNNTAGWRIKPPEENITIYLTGNLAVEDTSLPAFKPTNGAYTAAILGLQPVTQGVTPEMGEQLGYASYNGAVTYDSVKGHSLAYYVAADVSNPGSEQYPLSSLTDVLVVAVDRGFRRINIRGDLTIDAGDWAEGYSFWGEDHANTLITVNDIAGVDNCSFHTCRITGTMDDRNHVNDCVVMNLLSFDGMFHNCGLMGTVTLGGTQQSTFVNCYSMVAGSSTPTVDMGGSGSAFALRGYNGGIKIANKTGTDACSMDFTSGQLIVDSTVTAGDIYVRGVGKLTDNSTGTANVVADDFLRAAVIMDGIKRTTFIGKDGAGVTVSPATGTDGTEWPLGTRENPCQTEDNFHTIGTVQGLRNIYVVDSITLTGYSGDGHNFYGDNPLAVNVNVGDVATYPSKDVTNCKFQDCYLTGELDANNIVWECIVGSITNANGFLYKSALIGPIVPNGALSINKCWASPTAVNANVDVDFNNQAVSVFISQWEQGKITVKNMVAGSVLHMAGTGGRLIVDVSCTGGTVAYGGAIALFNNGSPDMVMKTSIADSVWTIQTDDQASAGSFGEKVGKKLLTFAKFMGNK